jgi:hypothetical protein
MKKILLALTILSVGAGAFQIARQSTNRLQEEIAKLHQSWMVETQWLATAQIEQAGLAERGGEMKRTLALTPVTPENQLWLALQTNRADCLPSKLQKRLREEFGFTWQSMKDYVVVRKHTVRKLGIQFIPPGGRFNDAALGALAITSEERARLEAAIEQAKTDFKDWVKDQVQRGEPADDVVAHYTLAGDATMARGITNEFFSAVAEAVGEQRAELIHDTALTWMEEMGVSHHSTRLTIMREMDGGDSRLKVEMRENGRNKSAYLPLKDDDFPKALRLLFPNRWAGLAEREGFELPKEVQKK